MRIPATLCAARLPQNESKVPFQEILPLRLKNAVSGKADSQTEVACMQEMSVLFACLKNNDFVEQYCSKEISNFNGCYKSFLDRKFQQKKAEHQGVIVPGKNLNYKQLNKYLRSYPNPK
uniref:CHCH domain-containing protein n=1 Tax=Tabanus bromius TaxID=304241 RepID=A0A0K8TN87_TABBR